MGQMGHDICMEGDVSLNVVDDFEKVEDGVPKGANLRLYFLLFSRFSHFRSSIMSPFLTRDQFDHIYII